MENGRQPRSTRSIAGRALPAIPTEISYRVSHNVREFSKKRVTHQRKCTNFYTVALRHRVTSPIGQWKTISGIGPPPLSGRVSTRPIELARTRFRHNVGNNAYVFRLQSSRTVRWWSPCTGNYVEIPRKKKIITRGNITTPFHVTMRDVRKLLYDNDDRFTRSIERVTIPDLTQKFWTSIFLSDDQLVSVWWRRSPLKCTRNTFVVLEENRAESSTGPKTATFGRLSRAHSTFVDQSRISDAPNSADFVPTDPVPVTILKHKPMTRHWWHTSSQ